MFGTHGEEVAVSRGEYGKCTPGADKGHWCSQAGQNYPCAQLFPGIPELCCSVSAPAVAAATLLPTSWHQPPPCPHPSCAVTPHLGAVIPPIPP